jgi:hypothetical protein
MKTVRKVKIRKTKIKFPLISIQKILTGSRLPEKSLSIFPTHVTILYKHKNKDSVTFYDSYYPFNPVKHYWSVKSNVYTVQQLL